MKTKQIFRVILTSTLFSLSLLAIFVIVLNFEPSGLGLVVSFGIATAWLFFYTFVITPRIHKEIYAEEQKWECSSCKFKNEKSKLFCDSCGKYKEEKNA